MLQGGFFELQFTTIVQISNFLTDNFNMSLLLCHDISVH